MKYKFTSLIVVLGISKEMTLSYHNNLNDAIGILLVM